MKMRRLLASTAVALLVAGPLGAQQASEGVAAPDAPATATPPETGVPGGLFLPSMPDAIYASELIGMDVYSSETDYAADYGDDRAVTPDARSQWDEIGQINDVVLSPAGAVQAVLVDVGGFLGIGTHTVAVDMSQLHILRGDDDARFAAVTSSADALRAAPEYERQIDQTAEVADAAAPGMATAPTRPSFEREGFADADYNQLTAEDLEGTAVYDANDENIGSLEELILSTDGKIEQAVIDVGGFLGMGERRIGLAFDEMQVMTNADNSEVRVYIDQTRETLEQRPEYQE
jgi:sporulation protein YlmC with PRC-barrel domain